MHLIGESFTGLLPGIDFSEAVLKATPATPCDLIDPPERCESVHTPELINAWQNQLLRWLAQPVQIEYRKGRRRVHVLGEAIFDIDLDGSIEVYVWTFRTAETPVLERLPAAAVAAVGVPYRSSWMKSFQNAALSALLLRHPGQTERCRIYVAWIQEWLEATFWGLGTQEIVRRQIEEALVLDKEILQIASGIQRSVRPNPPVRLDTYNHVIGCRTDYATLCKEAPQLLQLYALTADLLSELDVDGEVTEQMRSLFTNLGIRPATWRMLCREGSEWMKPFMAFFEPGRQARFDIATDLLWLAQAFGTQRLVPEWLLAAFIQLGGHPNRPHAYFAARLNDLFPLCRRLGHLLAQVDQATYALLQDKAQEIFLWASDHLREVPPQTLRRATVQWLVRQVESQVMRDALALHGEAPWNLPYRIKLRQKGVSAVVLDSPLTVWQEGQTMRHCADKYIDRCAKGRVLMVSLRSTAQSRPLATITFNMHGSIVRQDQIAGFANELVSVEIEQMAQRCLRQLQSQHRVIEVTRRET